MSATQKARVPVIFGAMTFGREGVEQARIHDLKEAGAMLDLFQEHGGTVVDTARVYAQGSSEEYLGQLNWKDRGLRVDTKLYPNIHDGTGKITHSPRDLRTHLEESLKALKTDKIDLWYLHGPDRDTPFEVTLKACNELHKEGKFNRLGLSNYMAWEVAYISELCIREGWVRPTVYQGVYNAIHRTVEMELFPCLRHYGITFYAFSPLAGSQLTGRYKRDTQDTDIEAMSRFDPNTFQGRKYRRRFWKDVIFDAVELIREEAGKHGLTEMDCAFRWIEHHSQLDPDRGDSVIIGASSKSQLEQNLCLLEKGPLPKEIVDVLDKAWLITKGSVNNYWH
ncbi:potassium channel beta subunit [Fusarium beomiforme]|uniref:Potassium channel beta subunit n=1 Tax=Fusarium beomiforme TaxID=44412 RepID=A0A9P5A652_9HYPO|nr:potassium channel beta subunit [Fusarium beomiforme]